MASSLIFCKMIVEFIGIKNGEITRRFKEMCIKFDYDLHGFLVGDKYFEYDKFYEGFDRIKLFVDGNEWINESLVKIDLSSFKIGEMYEFSDDFKTWKLKKLGAINEENEHPFVTYGEDMLTRSVSFAWRYCREVIK